MCQTVFNLVFHPLHISIGAVFGSILLERTKTVEAVGFQTLEKPKNHSAVHQSAKREIPHNRIHRIIYTLIFGRIFAAIVYVRRMPLSTGDCQ